MDKLEYEDKLKEIERRFDDEKSELAKEYAFSNNPYKKGDKIKDSIGYIEILLIQFTRGANGYFSKLPECCYTGVELKKDLTPTKKGDRRKIYQSSILTSEK